MTADTRSLTTKPVLSASDSTGEMPPIELPLTVTLSVRKFSVGQLLDLTPGTLINLGTSSDAPLVLEAGQQTFATGQCVKQGERIGLRIETFTRTGQ